jgi:hypothetical protein
MDEMISRRMLLRTSAATGLGSVASSFFAQTGAVAQGDAAVPVPAPRIARFERMAFGMFVHWGLYAQIGRGEWAKNNQKISTEEYMKLMKTFTAKDFDGRHYARLAKRAGMKYITLTSRHHDGFSLYDTRGMSPFDVTHTPAKRDLIRDRPDPRLRHGLPRRRHPPDAVLHHAGLVRAALQQRLPRLPGLPPQ